MPDNICKQNYFTIDDSEIDDILFTKENLDNFLLFQRTVEVAGIIGQTEIVNSTFMKFQLANKAGLFIEILMDSKAIIEKFRSLIIVHIDGGFVKKKHAAKSNSSIEFDLKLMSNTQVNLLKAAPEFMPVKKHGNFVVTTIEDSVKHRGQIQIIGYMKQKIARSSTPSGDINQGCISDCKLYKLEIRMPIVCDMTEFPVGSHVRITGIMKNMHNQPYFWVLTKEDVQLECTEKKSLAELLKGVKSPKRILQDINNRNPTKTFCNKMI